MYCVLDVVLPCLYLDIYVYILFTGRGRLVMRFKTSFTDLLEQVEPSGITCVVVLTFTMPDAVLEASRSWSSGRSLL